ncbi:hypothetical protein [Nonomuraea insulae]|uniref:Uncharacterized protein n=1 Tax=Nonomuraea insulae TaxID=1616787 RepID=A0ABW1CVU4_9ACTN
MAARGPAHRRLRGTGLLRHAFSPIEEKVYRRERVLTADQWVGLVATSSDHLQLGAERLTALLRVMHGTIESLGGHVRIQHETAALICHRRPAPSTG